MLEALILDPDLIFELRAAVLGLGCSCAPGAYVLRG